MSVRDKRFGAYFRGYYPGTSVSHGRRNYHCPRMVGTIRTGTSLSRNRDLSLITNYGQQYLCWHVFEILANSSVDILYFVYNLGEQKGILLVFWMQIINMGHANAVQWNIQFCV